MSEQQENAPVEFDLAGYSDEELAAIRSAVREEQNRRYQRVAFPQQITAAIRAAAGAGIPAAELQAAIDVALPDTPPASAAETSRADDTPTGAQ